MTAAACGDAVIQGVEGKGLVLWGTAATLIGSMRMVGALLGGLLVQNTNCGARELGFAVMDRQPFLGQELRKEAQVPSQPSPTTLCFPNGL